MKPIVNRAIATLKESATLMINEKAKSLRRAGHSVCHFGFGQSPFPVHESIQEALKKNSYRKEYLPTLGLLELRETICDFYQKYYKYEFSPDCICIGPGSKELIFQALFVLEGPLLIPAPSWVSYGPQAHIRGKQIAIIHTSKDHDYKLTAQALQEACDAQKNDSQRILIINNPNNPTGMVYSDSEIKQISEVARKNSVIIISDEIYALINFNHSFSAGFSFHYPEGTIVTGGLSKGHSAGGYRLGFIAVPKNMEAVIQCLMSMVSETFSAVSSPIQAAAIAAFGGNKEEIAYTQNCTAIHKAAGYYMHRRFIEIGAFCPKPQGAFYLFPDFMSMKDKLKTHGIFNSPDLSNALLEEIKVVALPAYDFYCHKDYLGLRIATVDYNGASVYKASLQYSKELDDQFIEENCPQLKEGMDRIQKFFNK